MPSSKSNKATKARADCAILTDVAELVGGGAPEEFSAGTVDALHRAVALRKALTPSVLRSLQSVIDYDWAVEERAFHASEPEGREHHVFTHLRRLRRFTRACARLDF